MKRVFASGLVAAGFLVGAVTSAEAEVIPACSLVHINDGTLAGSGAGVGDVLSTFGRAGAGGIRSGSDGAPARVRLEAYGHLYRIGFVDYTPALSTSPAGVPLAEARVLHLLDEQIGLRQLDNPDRSAIVGFSGFEDEAPVYARNAQTHVVGLGRSHLGMPDEELRQFLDETSISASQGVVIDAWLLAEQGGFFPRGNYAFEATLFCHAHVCTLAEARDIAGGGVGGFCGQPKARDTVRVRFETNVWGGCSLEDGGAAGKMGLSDDFTLMSSRQKEVGEPLEVTGTTAVAGTVLAAEALRFDSSPPGYAGRQPSKMQVAFGDRSWDGKKDEVTVGSSDLSAGGNFNLKLDARTSDKAGFPPGNYRLAVEVTCSAGQVP